MNRIKKLLIVFVFLVVGLVCSVSFHASSVGTVYFHYYRLDGNYTGWDMWIWESAPSSLGGAGYDFIDDATDSNYNFGGKVVVLDLEKTGLKDATQLGFIVRQGGSSWSGKDVDADRFVDIKKDTTDGTQHVYIVQGEPTFGSSLDDPDTPSRTHKITSGYFVSNYKIEYFSTDKVVSAKVYCDGEELTISNPKFETKKGSLEVTSKVSLTSKYIIEATFSNGDVSQTELTFDGLYDSAEFNEAYGYTGNDLGAVVTNNKTTFKLWAPVSEKVEVNLYKSGTPSKYSGGSDEKTTYEMTRKEKGVFELSFDENLHNTYYTYTVYNGKNVNEVVDPYAKSVGINGERGLVVDFSKVNPSGFEYGKRANNITNITDAIIYELHVRDLTSSSTWNGSIENKMRYLGLVEAGTTYEGVSTGFDHIKELGVTHVQLQPIFDYGNAVDESDVDSNGIVKKFNWGYMPENYNALEGAYSKNPYDGLERIKEMKMVVMAFTEANIRVNMDVVYNHTGKTDNSNFNLIVPGYYYRKTSTGKWSNGSGCGNETASERFMVRKFIVDSVVFWASEYNFSGFRFDLMGLHDVETMNEVAKALKEIDPTIMVYGEPWTGGTTTLSSNLQATKETLREINGVGAFNDDIRDAVKGSVFEASGTGFVQGSKSLSAINKIKFSIAGGVEHDEVNELFTSTTTFWAGEPDKMINYVTCHDNNTLYDKLMQSSKDTSTDAIKEELKQANAIVLLAEGVSFLHAGDEFMRSKPDGKGGYDSNSYDSSDEVNQIDWSLKVKYKDVFDYFVGLIALRKSTPEFRLAKSTDIASKLHFVDFDAKEVIGYTIDSDSKDYSKILVIHANAEKEITLPEGKFWKVVVDKEIANNEAGKTYKGGEVVTISKNETLVLFEVASGKASGGCRGCGSTMSFISLLPCLGLVFLFRRRRWL